LFPIRRVGFPRVTHPCAALLPLPKQRVLARLACVKRAANVRSEPGSNSPVKLIESEPAARTGPSRTHHSASNRTVANDDPTYGLLFSFQRSKLRTPERDYILGSAIDAVKHGPIWSLPSRECLVYMDGGVVSRHLQGAAPTFSSRPSGWPAGARCARPRGGRPPVPSRAWRGPPASPARRERPAFPCLPRCARRAREGSPR
jgi:hypothetical protein